MARRARGLRDLPALPSGDPRPLRPTPVATSQQEVFLLRPEDYVHPSKKAAVAAKAEAMGGRWVVTPPGQWVPIKAFRTAYQARVALRAAGFRGPQGKGTSSRWVR